MLRHEAYNEVVNNVSRLEYLSQAADLAAQRR